MAVQKILIVTLLAVVVQCEPPVPGHSGYNYQPPSTNYGAPSNGYRAPSNYHATNSYKAPSSAYGAPSYNTQSSSFAGHGSSYSAPSSSYNAPSSSYNAPSSSYGAPSSGHGGSYDNHDHGHDNEVPKSYEFGYTVKDAQSGNDYGRQETSDGNTVRGEYRVQLPDGRTQIVTYHADWQTGFHADVRYEGEARYPEPNQASNAYLPPQTQGTHNNYNAPSDFSGSLTGFHGTSNSGYNRPSTAYGPPGYHH